MARTVDQVGRREVRELNGRVVMVSRGEGAEAHPFVLAGVVLAHLVLVPDSSGSREFGSSLGEGDPLALGVADPKGRLGCSVLVQRYRNDPHELHVTDPGFFHLRNDRSAFRVAIEAPVLVATATAGESASASGVSIDLSSAGLSARVPLAAADGAPVFVSIRLPDGPVLAVGVVVGPVGDRVRIRFTQVDPAGVTRLTGHLRRAEIEQAARTGDAA